MSLLAPLLRFPGSLFLSGGVAWLHECGLIALGT